MRFWDEYPTISKISGTEVSLENPGKKELIDSIEELSDDEYLVLYNYDIIPDEFIGPKDFMTNGPELKIKKVDSPPIKHFKNQLSKYNPYRPKRGMKWTKEGNNTSIFFSISSLIDGAKLFFLKGDEICVGGRERKAWLKVPSRSDEKKHKVALDPLPDKSGKNWHEFFADCDCEEHFYYKHSSFKYSNPECYICPHIVAGYHRTMKIFPEMGEEPISPLFPMPNKELLYFDDNLAKTFIKDKFRRRLTKGEREYIHSLRQGYEKSGLTFTPKWL